MSAGRGDALVFYGATGDLAFKKIFPSLQGMIRRGVLDVPIIGVAKQGWKLEQFKARAKDSLEKHGVLDAVAFARMLELLRYVDGDYEDPATFAELKRTLGGARRPVHYLAIPQGVFGLVTQQLARAGCVEGARGAIGIGQYEPPSCDRHLTVAFGQYPQGVRGRVGDCCHSRGQQLSDSSS